MFALFAAGCWSDPPPTPPRSPPARSIHTGALLAQDVATALRSDRAFLRNLLRGPVVVGRLDPSAPSVRTRCGAAAVAAVDEWTHLGLAADRDDFHCAWHRRIPIAVESDWLVCGQSPDGQPQLTLFFQEKPDLTLVGVMRTPANPITATARWQQGYSAFYQSLDAPACP